MPLTAEDRKQLKTKSGYKIDVEIKPGMPLGQFHDELVIKTDHPKRAEVKVSISGNVNGPITVVPERLRMPNVIGSNRRFQEVMLMVRGGKPTDFEVVHKPDKLEVAIAPNTDIPSMKGRYRVTVNSAAWYRPRLGQRYDHPQDRPSEGQRAEDPRQYFRLQLRGRLRHRSPGWPVQNTRPSTSKAGPIPQFTGIFRLMGCVFRPDRRPSAGHGWATHFF